MSAARTPAPAPGAMRPTRPDGARRAALGVIALAALAGVATGASGCLSGKAFACGQDGECTGAEGGRCEAVGYCSFADSSCAAGQRFGDHSGPYAGQCVGASGDAGADAPPDISTGRCPSGYAPLSGAPGNLYRALSGQQTWTGARTTCMNDGAYLVEPGGLPELQAVVALTGAAEPWVGVTDQATEGTYVTGRGAPATYLPWDAGEPNDEPGAADCVRAKPTAVYGDDSCFTQRPAICECEP